MLEWIGLLHFCLIGPTGPACHSINSLPHTYPTEDVCFKGTFIARNSLMAVLGSRGLTITFVTQECVRKAIEEDEVPS